MSKVPAAKSPLLSEALKLVRRRRGLSAVEVAARMNLNIRTFRHFESGRTYLDFPRIQAFARATDSDAHAILAAVMLESPAFALYVIDNKLMAVIMAGVRRFDDRLGDRMARIEVSRLVAAFRRTFDELEADLIAREAASEQWLGEGPAKASGKDGPK